MLLFAGSTPIGSLLLGTLAEHGGVQPAVLEAAVVCGLGTFAGLLYPRHARARLTDDAPLPSPASSQPVLARQAPR